MKSRNFAHNHPALFEGFAPRQNIIPPTPISTRLPTFLIRGRRFPGIPVYPDPDAVGVRETVEIQPAPANPLPEHPPI